MKIYGEIKTWNRVFDRKMTSATKQKQPDKMEHVK